jgi:hypothetical protein
MFTHIVLYSSSTWALRGLTSKRLLLGHCQPRHDAVVEESSTIKLLHTPRPYPFTLRRQPHLLPRRRPATTSLASLRKTFPDIAPRTDPVQWRQTVSSSARPGDHPPPPAIAFAPYVRASSLNSTVSSAHPPTNSTTTPSVHQRRLVSRYRPHGSRGSSTYSCVFVKAAHSQMLVPSHCVHQVSR